LIYSTKYRVDMYAAKDLNHGSSVSRKAQIREIRTGTTYFQQINNNNSQ